MSLVIPPGFGSAALVFLGSSGTAPYVTTVGVDLSEVGGDYVTAADQVMAAYEATLLDETHESITLDHVTLAVGQDGGENPSVQSSRSPQNGGRSGNSEPIALAVLASKVTNQLGRQGRGRMFLPGLLTSSDVDLEGIIAPARRSALQDLLDAFGVELSTGVPGADPPLELAMAPVLLHEEGVDAPDPSPIVGINVQSKVGVLKGRLR